MGKIWKRTDRDLNNFVRSLHPGKTVYTIVDVATNLAPYEDPQLYSAYTFERRSRITGEWMTAGRTTARHLLFAYGPVHEEPPTGMRNLAGPGPQVAGPLPAGEEFDRRLDADEVEHMEKLAREARDARPKRKASWS